MKLLFVRAVHHSNRNKTGVFLVTCICNFSFQNRYFPLDVCLFFPLDSFLLLAILNNVAMNVIEQVSLWEGGASFGYMPRIGIAGS